MTQETSELSKEQTWRRRKGATKAHNAMSVVKTACVYWDAILGIGITKAISTVSLATWLWEYGLNTSTFPCLLEELQVCNNCTGGCPSPFTLLVRLLCYCTNRGVGSPCSSEEPVDQCSLWAVSKGTEPYLLPNPP